ncbi:NADPH:quinone reductase [Planotetraspora kaengkrachanensis]|uniref:NADPH:quinone reductase n=1 Tax=Planotetraspora kaengkrachanensis TaxID=575193 RepID=UPI001EF38BC3|nr:NADPH:quinone reductase [Planotetraspora kaengkrachanensis]
MIIRAAYVDQRGPASSIRFGELPDPVAAPGEVLVRVAATAVNRVDTFVRSGAYHTPIPLPLVLGRDLVGEVADPGASGLAPGTRVWTNSLGYGGRQGASAELACVPADRLYRLPDGVDPLDAVAVLHPAATAYTGLVHHARMRSGETLFVAGGNGAVGTCLIRIAKDLGVRVIAAARGSRNTEYCAELGADAVIDSTAADPVAALRGAAPRGVDVYCDTTGRDSLRSAVDALADRGRVLVMAGLANAQGDDSFDVGRLYTHDRSVVGFAISLATTAELAEAAAWINRRLPRDGLRLDTTVLPLAQARAAHEDVEAAARGESRRYRGRIVLRVGPGL